VKSSLFLILVFGFVYLSESNAASDEFTLRFTGGVEILIVPENRVGHHLVPVSPVASTSATAAAELSSILDRVAASGAEVLSSLTPVKPKAEPLINRARQLVRDSMASGSGEPPSKRSCP
jgi:hypothetical protein